MKTFLRTGFLLLLLALIAYLFRIQLLTDLAAFLIIDDHPQKGDVIFVLNGDVDTRPFFAAKLFHEKRAPGIAIVRGEDGPAAKAGLFPNETDVAVKIMKKRRVPATKIAVLPFSGGATSTRDEATALKRYAASHGIRRVILVTSSFHSRRALWIMRKELAGTHVAILSAPAPYNEFDKTSWWKEERGLIALFDEYVKLAYYRVKY